jgi:hypothetical protein
VPDLRVHFCSDNDREPGEVEPEQQQDHAADDAICGFGCIEELGASPSALKSAAGTLFGTIHSVSTGLFADETVKNALADYATEHFDIACYRALRPGARSTADSTHLAATTRVNRLYGVGSPPTTQPLGSSARTIWAAPLPMNSTDANATVKTQKEMIVSADRESRSLKLFRMAIGILLAGANQKGRTIRVHSSKASMRAAFDQGRPEGWRHPSASTALVVPSDCH